jgi:hypothetical protein
VVARLRRENREDAGRSDRTRPAAGSPTTRRYALPLLRQEGIPMVYPASGRVTGFPLAAECSMASVTSSVARASRAVARAHGLPTAR